ncbi:MAG: hypothetical protein IPM37_18655 [Hahellaceae bacterium]|nr:hypothetical protein [Hahellaceae bacterium]
MIHSESTHAPLTPPSTPWAGLIAVLVFGIAFLMVPFTQLNLLSLIPGDIGDARLNNYFLENIYQYFKGNSESLIHLGFFYPFPYVGGFSDNLFGSSPIYLLARLFLNDPFTAFQVWFLFGYPINFVACYIALRKLGFSSTATLVGSLIFTFALPVTAHAMHAQLHYRFGVPLALASYLLFLRRPNPTLLLAAIGWTVWQFYCTIYIGFFLLLFLIATTLTWSLLHLKASATHRIEAWQSWRANWGEMTRSQQWLWIATLALLAVLFGLLFYAYLRVSDLYGAKRSLSEIANMLPRPQSYFLAGRSWLWSSDAQFFANIPMRHEHQMFPGAIPVILGLAGVFIWRRQTNGPILGWLGSAWAGLIIVTLSVGTVSLWYILAGLPLFSAIRVITRIDLVFLVPLAAFAALATERLLNWRVVGPRVLFIVILPLMLMEMAASTPLTSAKQDWQNRLDNEISRIPPNLDAGAVLFFSQASGPWFADEIDAMWASLLTGHKTLNGYSGLFPPGYNPEFGQRCSELPARISSFQRIIVPSNPAETSYARQIEDVTPIGFTDCQPEWWNPSTGRNLIDRPYKPDELKALHLGFSEPADETRSREAQSAIRVRLINDGGLDLACCSTLGRPIRLSWRWIDQQGVAMSGWDARVDVLQDIPANNSIAIEFNPGQPPEQAGALEISWVHEGEFWGHDIGAKPLRIALEL